MVYWEYAKQRPRCLNIWCILLEEHTEEQFLAAGSLIPCLRNCMEDSPCWDSNKSSACQEIPDVLCNPEVHYRILQVPANCPFPEGDESSPFPHLTSWWSIVILSHTCWVGPFPSGFLSKTLCSPLLCPYMLHALPNVSWFNHPNNNWWGFQFIKVVGN